MFGQPLHLRPFTADQLVYVRPDDPIGLDSDREALPDFSAALVSHLVISQRGEYLALVHKHEAI